MKCEEILFGLLMAGGAAGAVMLFVNFCEEVLFYKPPKKPEHPWEPGYQPPAGQTSSKT